MKKYVFIILTLFAVSHLTFSQEDTEEKQKKNSVKQRTEKTQDRDVRQAKDHEITNKKDLD